MIKKVDRLQNAADEIRGVDLYLGEYRIDDFGQFGFFLFRKALEDEFIAGNGLAHLARNADTGAFEVLGFQMIDDRLDAVMSGAPRVDRKLIAAERQIKLIMDDGQDA